jgi:hypothetical protein
MTAPKKAVSAGRHRASGVGDWLPMSQIAMRAKIDRETVTKYLRMEGAPKPDEMRRFNYREALAWIEKNAPRAAGNSAELNELKKTQLRIKNEIAEIDLKVKRGQFFDKREIEPAILKFNTQLTQDLQAKFELELPTKYAGKTVAEIQQMNAAAVDWVLNRLKEGQQPITITE